MKRVIFHSLIVGILIIGIAYADDYISDVTTKEGNVQLNEELRQLRKGSLWNLSGEDIELRAANDIDFQQKEAQQLVIENLTSDPSSPVTGQIWFRSDL